MGFVIQKTSPEFVKLWESIKTFYNSDEDLKLRSKAIEDSIDKIGVGDRFSNGCKRVNNGFCLMKVFRDGTRSMGEIGKLLSVERVVC